MRINPISYNTNLYFGNEEARKLAENTTDIMKLQGVRKSIMQNRDDNEYDGRPFRNEDAYPILDTLEKEFAQQDITNCGDILEWCSNFIDNFGKHPLSKDDRLPEDIRDAVIISYLNRLPEPAHLDANTTDLNKNVQ